MIYSFTSLLDPQFHFFLFLALVVDVIVYYFPWIILDERNQIPTVPSLPLHRPLPPLRPASPPLPPPPGDLTRQRIVVIRLTDDDISSTPIDSQPVSHAAMVYHAAPASAPASASACDGLCNAT